MVVDMAKASDGVLGPVFLQPVLLHALVRQIANGFGAIFVAFALDVRIEIPPTGLSPREMVLDSWSFLALRRISFGMAAIDGCDSKRCKPHNTASEEEPPMLATGRDPMLLERLTRHPHLRAWLGSKQ